ncbi:uncharacterized protein LOC142338695 [Convolutriloba macropyga]|uniref:uncharacterized protein LOC142338695 n=1 Tax=Convolutriloba macropyga TaxID=536237 RepID=UPI003F51C27C
MIWDQNGIPIFCSDKGGELTLLITGKSRKLPNGRPQRVPLFGTKTSYNPEIIAGKYVYASLVDSIVQKSDDDLISQSVHDGEFYGIFGSHSKLSGATKWRCSTWSNIIDYINEAHISNYHVCSLAADQVTGLFYAYLMQGAQIVSTRNSWSKTRDKIREEYDDGKIITGICYNTGEKSYMVVMTESPSEQSYKWFGPDDVTERKSWMHKQMDDGKCIQRSD